MKNNTLKLLLINIAILFLFGVTNSFAQDKLVSVEFPNGTTDVSNEVTDATSGYKLTYYNLKYLQNVNDKTYYQFNSGMGSYVKIEAPSGEYFQQGDEIKIDTYVNRGSSDSRIISIYNQVNYSSGVLLGSVSAAGSVASVYTIVLGANLPDKTNVLYMPATSSINSYINVHGVEVYGERGTKAKLASLTLGGKANLNGYKVSYTVDATSAETTTSISYTKEEGKDVVLAISNVQTASISKPAELSEWNTAIPSSVAIPSIPGESYYYYIRSSLADHETIYYELEITKRNTADVVYNYDLTVNPITSVEDPTLSNIENTAGYHSAHGWRFNYASGSTLRVKVEGDAIIKLRGCVYNNENSKITATVNDESAGSITPNYQITAKKDCAGYNNFYYSGEANTITFTYSGVTFLSYITIINEGSGEADLRAVFVGDSEISLADFKNGEYTLPNMGYVANPAANEAFPEVAFGMKKGLTAPSVNGLLNVDNKMYTQTFMFEGTTYKIHIPYESEIGYAENATEQRYDISSSFGLKTVVKMMNEGTAIYSTIYLPNGTYYLGDVDGSYQHGITLTASNITIIGESHQARITGKYYGVTSSVVELKGANTIVRNLTIENIVGDNGVAPALSTGADNILFDKVQIIGWQDTYVGGDGKHLFNECIVVGSVDFICNGAATDYFLRCELQLQYRKNGGYITAPQGNSYFRDCRVTNAPNNATSMSGNFSLARPWRTTGKAFFVNTTFDIVPNYGFVTMSGNVFPTGSSGSVGNLKESDKTLLNFSNDANTEKYEMTEADIIKYSSIYNICGSTLAALVSESVVLPAHRFATLYVADALEVPTGISTYAIINTNNDYAELGKLFTAGDIIPACTPVVLNAEINEETTFLFAYADNGSAAKSSTNLLSGSLVHKSLSDENTTCYFLDYNNSVVAFSKQDSPVTTKANEAYLALNSITVNSLPLKGGTLTSIIDVISDTIKGDNIVYDLYGRRVSQPQKGQIYIVNGSKRFFY